MKRLSFDRITKQLDKAKAKFGKYVRPVLGGVFVGLIAVLIYWLIFGRFPFMNPPRNIPVPTPTPSPVAEPIRIPESTTGAKDRGATPSEKDKRCCYNMNSGIYVERPPSVECMKFEFGRRMDDIDKMLAALNSGADITIFGTPGQREFNGYVTSTIGKESLSKYIIYLYSDDTINYEYNPPYVYRSTTCTLDLKQKITGALDPLR